MKIAQIIKAKVIWLFSILRLCISKMFALIYDYAVSYPVTVSIYKYMQKTKFYSAFPNSKPDFKGTGITMLDIGTASGTCLKNILDKGNFERVLGIDIDKEYVKSSTHLFRDHKNVEIRLQNFETYIEDGNTERFDIVFFGFSFMLMPDKSKALEVARRIIKPGGKIYAFLTLYEKKNKFIEWIKPKIVKFTSIEFGEVMYRNQVS